MSQTQNPCTQQTQTTTQQRREIIEAYGNYKLYREYNPEESGFRLVKEYRLPRGDMCEVYRHIIEIYDNDVLRVAELHAVDRGGENLYGGNGYSPLGTKLEPCSLKKVRDFMLRVKSVQQFDELMHWLLTAKYVTQPCAVMAIESTKEPSF